MERPITEVVTTMNEQWSVVTTLKRVWLMYLQCLVLIVHRHFHLQQAFENSAVKGRFTEAAAAATAAAWHCRQAAAAADSEEKPIKSWIASTPPLACPWCCSTSPHDPNGHSALLVMCALQNKALIDRHAVIVHASSFEAKKRGTVATAKCALRHGAA